MKGEIFVYLTPILIFILFAGFEWLFFLINRLKRINNGISRISFINYVRCSIKNKPKQWEKIHHTESIHANKTTTFWLQLGIVLTALILVAIIIILFWDFAALRSWRINKYASLI